MAGREPTFVDVGFGLGWLATALGVGRFAVAEATRLAFAPLEPGDEEGLRWDAVVVDLVAELAGELQEWKVAFSFEVAAVIDCHQR